MRRFSAESGLLARRAPVSAELEILRVQGPLPLSGPILEQALDNGAAALAYRDEGHRRFTSAEAEIYPAPGYFMCTPLCLGGKAIGAAYIDSPEGRNRYEAQDLYAFAALCRQGN
jgi:hypothetical protein